MTIYDNYIEKPPFLPFIKGLRIFSKVQCVNNHEGVTSPAFIY